MGKFKCKFCDYSIERKVKPKFCPYCSKAEAMVEEENAEEIVVGA